ncbi:MAG: sigma-70 family RNA polymerase sigma factor [Candidatus Paceibacterota bacterium]|jgi:RNA polymerase sigma-70 factor (ECF subfamily)
MLPNEIDEEIILLYKNGDRKAFKILIDRYTKSLYNFTARLTNKNDASDIVQEIFIKVWKNIDHFDEEKASFKTWIFTIAKNTATDFLRKKKSLLFSDLAKIENLDLNNENENSFAKNIPDENLLPDEAMQKLQDSEFLNNTLKKLRPDYQEILVLHYQEEMTFEEIGKILNKPLNTVKSSHRRSIMELRKILR